MFHTHKYTEVIRRFTESSNRGMKLRGSNAIHTMNKHVYGFTSIELKCEKCGNIKFIEEIGDQT